MLTSRPWATQGPSLKYGDFRLPQVKSRRQGFRGDGSLGGTTKPSRPSTTWQRVRGTRSDPSPKSWGTHLTGSRLQPSPGCLLPRVWVFLLISCCIWFPGHLILPGLRPDGGSVTTCGRTLSSAGLPPASSQRSPPCGHSHGPHVSEQSPQAECFLDDFPNEGLAQGHRQPVAGRQQTSAPPLFRPPARGLSAKCPALEPQGARWTQASWGTVPV